MICLHAAKSGYKFVGTDLVCDECFERAVSEARLDYSRRRHELTLSRILPFDEVLAAMESGESAREPELIEDALRAVMETV